MKNRGKKSQITLFIVLGILVLVGIISLFFLFSKPEFVKPTKDKDFYNEITPCIKKTLEKVLPEYLEKGFYFDPNNKLVYQGKDVSYHCYTSAKKTICTRNDAQSKTRIEKELKEKILSDVENCFKDFKNSNPSYKIEMGELNFSIEIVPKRINLKAKREIKISKGESEQIISNFDSYLDSSLWDLIKISNEILNQESSCNCPVDSCTADTIGLMNKYNDYAITFFTGSKGDRVYTIKDYYNKTKLNFAVKNCDKTP